MDRAEIEKFRELAKPRAFAAFVELYNLRHRAHRVGAFVLEERLAQAVNAIATLRADLEKGR